MDNLRSNGYSEDEVSKAVMTEAANGSFNVTQTTPTTPTTPDNNQ
jgi:hypothetical protein